MSALLKLSAYAYSVYALPTFIVAAACLVLGVAVVLRERGTRISLAFLAIVVLASTWLSSFSMMYLAVESATALAWGRLAYLSIPSLPPAIYLFSSLVLQNYRQHRARIWMGWGLALIWTPIFLFTDWIIDGTYAYSWGFYPCFTSLSVPYFIYFLIFLFVSLRMYWQASLSDQSQNQRARIRALMAAFGLGYFGLVDYLAVFGLDVYPFGYLAIFGFLVVAGWAIMKYQLVDITPSFAANEIISTMPDLLLVVDAERRIRVANQAACDMLGYRLESMLGLEISAVLHAEGIEWAFGTGSRGPQPLRDVETQLYAQGGDPLDMSLSISPLSGRRGEMLGAVLVARDIRERKQAAEALRESEERYALAAGGANDGLWDWDLRTGRMYFSPRWKAMLGYAEEDVTTESTEWFERIHTEDLEQFEIELRAHLEDASPHFENEHRLLHRDGTYRWMLVRGSAVRGLDGAASRMAGSLTDITERKRTEQQLLHDAFHDDLTNLPNRALFLDRLGQALDRSRSRGRGHFAVLYMDLDRFKVVNDSLGHMIGDALLQLVAERLQTCLRKGDTVARLGGDEFGILLHDIRDFEEAGHVADRMHAAFRAPFDTHGHELFTSTSIGVAISSREYRLPDEILRDADIAMYQAKKLGSGKTVVFEAQMRRLPLTLLKMETDLHRALHREEFELHYQPIVELDTFAIVGLEALIRWRHPDLGPLPPSEFLPLAEETGLIIPLGRWILRTVCHQIKQLEEEGIHEPPLSISVNLSGSQLRQPDIQADLKDLLRESGIDPHRLKLEITENVLMEDLPAVHENIERLRHLGLDLHIDDFGTGHSSLSALHRLPINTLKIDRSFVTRLNGDAEALEVVDAIMALARSLRLNVIAEGIETNHQRSLLLDLNCRYGQGYLFSPPLPDEELAVFLKSSPLDLRSLISSSTSSQT